MSAGGAVSASAAKHTWTPFFCAPLVRHSGAFLLGNDVTAAGDSIRHESTITLTNVGNALVNANASIVSKAGTVTSFPKLLQPNGFTTVTSADLPPAIPLPFVGSAIVQYDDIGAGALLSCEEITQKHLIDGPRNVSMAMSVVEVQPIPLR